MVCIVNAVVTTALVVISLTTSALVPARDQSPLAGTDERQQTLRQYEAALENLETQYGPFDLRLQEPLSAMERLHEELGDFERVREIQSRRLQLVRTSLGLEHPEVIPLVEALVKTEIQLGNWDEVSDHLDHLRTLMQSIHGSESWEMVAAMERQADWYLARVYLDEDRERSRNFMHARETYKDLLDMATDRLGENNPQLIPWLSSRAYNLYQLVGLLNSNGGLGSHAIRETVRRDGTVRLQSIRSGLGVAVSALDPLNRVPITEKGEVLGSGYLRMAAGYMDDIRDIAEANGNWETWAMATLYRGDYTLLSGLRTGRSDHLKAIDKLLELGVDPQRVETLMKQPETIPVQKFYARFDEYESFRHMNRAGMQPLAAGGNSFSGDKPWEEPMHAGIFHAWEEDAGAIAMPPMTDPLLTVELPYHQVDLQFRVNSRGEVSAVKVLQSEPEESRARGIARRAARKLRFRPAYFDGRSRSCPHVQLSYRIVPDER